MANLGDVRIVDIGGSVEYPWRMQVVAETGGSTVLSIEFYDSSFTPVSLYDFDNDVYLTLPASLTIDDTATTIAGELEALGYTYQSNDTGDAAGTACSINGWPPSAVGMAIKVVSGTLFYNFGAACTDAGSDQFYNWPPSSGTTPAVAPFSMVIGANPPTEDSPLFVEAGSTLLVGRVPR